MDRATRDRLNKAAGKAPPPALAKPKAKQPPRSALQRDTALVQKGRLPDESVFEVRYLAAQQKWFGTLCIDETEHAEKQIFKAEAPGVFRLLSKLDDMYRQSLQQKGGDDTIRE